MNALKNQLRPGRRLAGAVLLAMTLAVAGLSTAAPAFADESKTVTLVGFVGDKHHHSSILVYTTEDGKVKDLVVRGDKGEISLRNERVLLGNPFLFYYPYFLIPHRVWEMSDSSLSKIFRNDVVLRFTDRHWPSFKGDSIKAILDNKHLMNLVREN